MKPRHFWWLVSEKLEEKYETSGKPKPLSKQEADHLVRWMERVNDGNTTN